jgi:hypothetical protein
MVSPLDPNDAVRLTVACSFRAQTRSVTTIFSIA